jgi:membrane protein implicated in regulation of membrane protease activity
MLTPEVTSPRKLSPRAGYALAAVIIGLALGVLTTFEIFGSATAALALVVAFLAWRTRPRTHGPHHRLAYVLAHNCPEES